MAKYNRIAVVIRGQKRVWDYVKHNIFYCYSSLADLVDYYFVTWKDPHNSTIVSDFENRNLIKFLELDKDAVVYNEFTLKIHNDFLHANYSPSYFSHNIIPYMLEYSDLYDCIFDQRTDCILMSKSNKDIVIKPNTVYVNHGVYLYSNRDSRGVEFERLHLNDLGYMCNFETYKLLSKRFKAPFDFKVHRTPEAHLYVYCVDNDINIDSDVFFTAHVFRPNQIEHLQHPIIDKAFRIYRDLAGNKISTPIRDYYEWHRKQALEWVSLSTKQKEKLCKKHNLYGYANHIETIGK